MDSNPCFISDGSVFPLIGKVEIHRDIKKLNFNKKSVFVFGNEANGMEKEVEKMCDELIKIKMSGHAESLNVGVATGIVLYLQDNLS